MIVVEMDMPSSCFACPLREPGDGDERCAAQGRFDENGFHGHSIDWTGYNALTMYNWREKTCPLKEVAQ